MNKSTNKAKQIETGIITKFIMPSIKNAGWGDMPQIFQKVTLGDGKVIFRGQISIRKISKYRAVP